MIDKRIIGTWRLKSTKGVDDNGKVLPPPYGPAPNRVVRFENDGMVLAPPRRLYSNVMQHQELFENSIAATPAGT